MPKIESEITTGLKVDPTLDKFVFVEVLPEALPYRVTTDWTPHDDQSRIVSPSFPPGVSIHQCVEKSFGGAIELAIDLKVALDDLTDNETLTMQSIKDFAQSAAHVERRTVLWLMADSATLEPVYSLETIKARASALHAPSRLIANGDIADTAKKDGFVDEVVSPMGSLPEGTSAMLVRLGAGPTVQRVVDGFTVTWRRMSDSNVRLRLSVRFFMNGEGAIKFS